jgi:hypothetical protein
MREAAAYDEEAVRLNQAQRRQQRLESSDHDHVGEKTTSVSELRQWPVQIKLVPAAAPYFHHARLLIAADCTAYACGDFHHRYMREKVTLIGCTKLDAVDYAEKLTEIFRQNDLQDITVVRMDVPCCGGMEHAVREAISRSGRQIPCHVITLGRDGRELRPDFTLSSLS